MEALLGLYIPHEGKTTDGNLEKSHDEILTLGFYPKRQHTTPRTTTETVSSQI